MVHGYVDKNLVIGPSGLQLCLPRDHHQAATPTGGDHFLSDILLRVSSGGHFCPVILEVVFQYSFDFQAEKYDLYSPLFCNFNF